MKHINYVVQILSFLLHYNQHKNERELIIDVFLFSGVLCFRKHFMADCLVNKVFLTVYFFGKY